MPDIVTLSKSISGYGLPMSLCLFKRELDVWEPGEHNGTFRGNNPAFVTATAALRSTGPTARWRSTPWRAARSSSRRCDSRARHAPGATYRGRGLVWGLEFADPAMAARSPPAPSSAGCSWRPPGPSDEVVKLLPPLTITPDEIAEGLGILRDAVAAVAAG